LVFILLGRSATASPGNRGVMRISKRTLTGILLLGIVLLLGMLVVVFVKYRDLSESPAALVEALPKGADIAIDDIRHTAVENGRKT
jgi:hypothetical protein